VSSDVLRGDSASALVESLLVTGLFIGREFAFGMSEEIGTVAAQSEHQEQLGIHARGSNVGGGEAMDC